MKTVQKFKKVFLVASLVFILLATPFQKASATGWPVSDFLGHLLKGLHTAATYVGLASTGAPGSGAGARVVLKAGKKPCDIAKKAQEIVNTADAFGAASAIAGNAGEIARLNTKITALTLVRTCYMAYQEIEEDAGSLASTVGGQQVLTALQEADFNVQQAILSLDKRIDDLVALRSQAVTSLWKAVGVRILYNVQHRIATKLINQMVAKYKIGNVTNYADAVASQIYTIDYIQKYHPDNGDQMILKGILQNSAVQGEMLPLVRTRSDLAFNTVFPDDLDLNSPDFFVRAAQAGSGETNPYYLQTVFQDKADSIHGQAASSAQNEISQGQGFMPVRHCQGLAEAEKSSDSKRLELEQDFKVKEVAYRKMAVVQLNNPESVDPQGFARAAVELAQARTNLNNFSNNNKSYLKRCEDIANPGSAVANYTTSYLNSYLNSANTPKGDNLPFFAGFIENVATNFITNFIETGKPNLQYLTGAGFQAGNIVANNIISGNPESGILKAVEDTNQSTSVLFVGQKDNDAGQYKLAWDASALTPLASGAYSIKITSGSFVYTSSKLNDFVTVNAGAGTVFTLNVLDASKNVKSTQTYTIPRGSTPNRVNLGANSGIDDMIRLVGETETTLKESGVIPPIIPPVEVGPPPGLTNDQWTLCQQQNYNPEECLQQNGIGSVSGAFISKLSPSIRGPVGIQPRGGE
jgi:hypothetical protein